MTHPRSAVGTSLPSRIFLIGFMGSGKSTCGPLIARILGYDFVDLDREVERLAGRPVAEIFRTEGEPSFRELEAEATRKLGRRSRIVIATGGGWTAGRVSEARLPSSIRVWLMARPDTLLARTSRQPETRPLLDREDPSRSIRALLAEREPSYARAEIRVETDGRTPDQVAAEVVRSLEGVDGSRAPATG